MLPACAICCVYPCIQLVPGLYGYQRSHWYYLEASASTGMYTHTYLVACMDFKCHKFVTLSPPPLFCCLREAIMRPAQMAVASRDLGMGESCHDTRSLPSLHFLYCDDKVKLNFANQPPSMWLGVVILTLTCHFFNAHFQCFYVITSCTYHVSHCHWRRLP